MFLIAAVLLVCMLESNWALQVQTCGVQGYPNNVVDIPGVTEGLPHGVIFARFQLDNVNTTTTVSSPTNKYVAAQRYQNGGYELMSTNDFKDFVRVERTAVLVRTANLYCVDGSTVVRVVFNIHVPDLNLNPPVFDRDRYYSPMLTFPVESDVVLQTGVVVSDADLELENANVVIELVFLDGSDAGYSWIPVVTPLWNESHPTQYEYELNLVLPSVRTGTNSNGGTNKGPMSNMDWYEYSVVATDGVHESSAWLLVMIRYDEPDYEYPDYSS